MSERTPAETDPPAPAPGHDAQPDPGRVERSRRPRHSAPDSARHSAHPSAEDGARDSAGDGARSIVTRDGDGNGEATLTPADDDPNPAGPAHDHLDWTDPASDNADPADPADPASDPADPARAETGDPEPATDEAPADGHGARVRHWREQSRKRRDEKRKRPWWIELPILVVIAFILTFLIQTFVARVYYVPSGSMEHTLHGTTNGGDRILAFKMVYDFREPEQGEVVVFKGPATWTPEANIPGPSTWLGKAAQALGSVIGIAPPNEKDFVKRVIAVGGQTISCCDAKGRVQVDGVSLDEPYIFMDADRPEWAWVDGESSCQVNPANPTQYESYRCFGPYKVPRGTVWVMGDHRSDSADSSYQCRGLVPAPDVHCQGPIPVKDVIGQAVAIVMPPSRWGGIGSPDIMSGAK